VRLMESLATTPQLAELFSDESVLKAMLQFETALARAEAGLSIVPSAAADAIANAAQTGSFDVAALAQAALRAGTLGVPLVKALTEQVRARDAGAAGYVHWGATSQDVVDTAMVLILKRARPFLVNDLTRLENALVGISERHAHTVMLGRTLLQPAPPVTFGLKAAGWLGAIHRGRHRLEAAFEHTLIVQFGGAAGTLAALGDRGPAVGRLLAEELGLGCPEAPWHTHRDRLAELVCACGILTGSLGKMARDISLLAQGEIVEVAEPTGPGRGGSSTMPQKQNPIGCVVTLAAANRVQGLVAGFLSAMGQEHERSAGGWQSEWPTLAAVIQTTGVALASMAEVAEGLKVDEKRMRTNLEAARGAVFSEKAMMLLGRALGRDVARKLVEDATRKSTEQGRRLEEVLSEMPEVTCHLDPATLGQLEDPEKYLGAAETFRTNLLSSAESEGSRGKKKE